jgi:hypothetical protein
MAFVTHLFDLDTIGATMTSPQQPEPTGWELSRSIDNMRVDLKDGFDRLEAQMVALRADFTPKEVFSQNKAETDRRLTALESSWRRLGPTTVSVLALLVSVAMMILAILGKK